MVTKLVDKDEALRWVREGRTYDWCRAQYRYKYDIETSRGMWERIRRQADLGPRITRNPALVPWSVLGQHKNAYELEMLRAEARMRDGRSVAVRRRSACGSFKRNLRAAGLVVHYDPVAGFSKVPARPGIDVDLIRVPNVDEIVIRRTRPKAVAA